MTIRLNCPSLYNFSIISMNVSEDTNFSGVTYTNFNVGCTLANSRYTDFAYVSVIDEWKANAGIPPPFELIKLLT